MLVAWAREDRLALIFPRVPVETPAPPMLGKETLAGLRLSVFLSVKFGIKRKGRRSLVVGRPEIRPEQRLTRTREPDD